MRLIAKIELALLLPITLVLAPLLTFGAGMLFVTVLLTLVGGNMRLRGAAALIGLILWLLAGLYGLVMVWIVTVEGESTMNFSLRQRMVRIAGLLAGAVAASMWLYNSLTTGAALEAKNAAFWGLLFLPPTALGLRHGVRLFWNDAHPLGSGPAS